MGKIASVILGSFIFITYALAVWMTAYQGLRGDDGLGLVCVLLLLAGTTFLTYLKVWRRTIPLGSFMKVLLPGLGLAGFGLGMFSSGEEQIGIGAGLTIAAIATIVIAVVVRRRRRTLKTLFISYRRADSGEITPHIQKSLSKRFGEENIFYDIDSIELGSNFREFIANAVNRCDALIVVIGEKWLELMGPNGQRRIDEIDDLVRVEVESGLNNPKVLVVPLAVNGADIPKEEELPESIRALALRNGGVVQPAPHFETDMSRLIRGLENGSITPWSHADSVSISWKQVTAMVAILCLPLLFWLLEDLTSNQRNITTAAVSPSQMMLATAHGSGIGVKSCIRIWDTQSGDILKSIQLDAGPVWALAWSPYGKYLALGDHDGTLTIFDTKSWHEMFKFEQHSGMLQKISWSHQGDRLAAGDKHGVLRVWDLNDGGLQYTAIPHSEKIVNLSWSPNDEKIATASWDKTAAISESNNGNLTYRLEGHSSHVNVVTWSADAETVTTGSLEEPYILLWRLRKGSRPQPLPGLHSKVEKVGWSPTNTKLASASGDEAIWIWDREGVVRHVLDVKGIGSPDFLWSADGKKLAATDDQSLWVWNLSSEQLIQRIVTHSDDYGIKWLPCNTTRRLSEKSILIREVVYANRTHSGAAGVS